MQSVDHPKFRVALKQLKELYACLTGEQLKLVRLVGFTFEMYEERVNALEITDEKAEENVLNVIKEIREELAKHAKQKEDVNATKLFARYQKLSVPWQIFVRKRFTTDSTDIWSILANLGNKTDAEYGNSKADEEDAWTSLQCFARIIKEVEDAIKEN